MLIWMLIDFWESSVQILCSNKKVVATYNFFNTLLNRAVRNCKKWMLCYVKPITCRDIVLSVYVECRYYKCLYYNLLYLLDKKFHTHLVSKKVF